MLFFNTIVQNAYVILSVTYLFTLVGTQFSHKSNYTCIIIISGNMSYDTSTVTTSDWHNYADIYHESARLTGTSRHTFPVDELGKTHWNRKPLFNSRF